MPLIPLGIIQELNYQLIVGLAGTGTLPNAMVMGGCAGAVKQYQKLPGISKSNELMPKN